MNSPLTTCHVLVGWIIGSRILCNEQRQAGMELGACLASCAPVRACQPEEGMSSCNSATREAAFCNLHNDTVGAALTGAGRSGLFLHPNCILWEPA